MKRVIYLLMLCLGLMLTVKAQIPNTLTPAQKVYGLSKFWQEVNYNFVYLNKVNRTAWDSLYLATIPLVQQTTDDYAYFHELQRFCAFLNDGHTNVYFPVGVQNLVLNTMFGKYRLFITNVDGRAIVTNTNLTIKDEVPTGSEVVTVNGLATVDYIKKYVSPYISSSTDYVRVDDSYSRLLQGVKGQTFEITVRLPDGKLKNLSLTHDQTTEKEIFPAIADGKLLDFKWYPGQIAYVALNSFGDEKIDSLFIQQLPELYKAKKLIIDLRQNGGGSTGIGVAILNYLTNDTVLLGSKVSTRIHEAAFKAWGKFVAPKDTVGSAWNIKAYHDYHDDRYEFLNDGIIFKNNITAKRIIVPTVILISHNTASAAEDFLIAADNQKHMVKMGENSFGSTGQPFQFDLPGGGSARVCTKKDTYPDGREFVGVGIKPDILVKRTYNDYVKNNDLALNKALSYLQGKTIENMATKK